MLTVGLTGGVASGKSTVARLLESAGLPTIDADRLVAELYRPGQPGARRVRGLFGDRALASDGGVDRETLRSIVLADADARRRLEGAIHPLVRERILEWRTALESRHPGPSAAVVEAALLVESGRYRDYERLVVVTAPLADRERRASAGGWNRDRFRSIEAAQTDDGARAAVADYVVRNDKGPEELERAVGTLRAHLREDARHHAAGAPLPPRRIAIRGATVTPL